MKAQAFLELVGRMRAAQSKYFRERTHSNLMAAKDLEKQVDAVVKAGKLEPDATVNLYVERTSNTLVETEQQMSLLEDQIDEGGPADEAPSE